MFSVDSLKKWKLKTKRDKTLLLLLACSIIILDLKFQQHKQGN